jgi:hypothetical protein
MATRRSGVNIPVEFSGPAQLVLFTRYGDPREPGFEQKWITDWFVQEHFPWFPKRQICVHKHFKTQLEKAFKDLAVLGLQDEIKTSDKGFVIRTIKGSPVLSLHSWGAAIDLNAKENPLGSAGKWSKEFIEVMVNNQIFCGQNWIGRKDPMHFAMVNG